MARYEVGDFVFGGVDSNECYRYYKGDTTPEDMLEKYEYLIEAEGIAYYIVFKDGTHVVPLKNEGFKFAAMWFPWAYTDRWYVVRFSVDPEFELVKDVPMNVSKDEDDVVSFAVQVVSGPFTSLKAALVALKLEGA